MIFPTFRGGSGVQSLDPRTPPRDFDVPEDEHQYRSLEDAVAQMNLRYRKWAERLAAGDDIKSRSPHGLAWWWEQF